MPARPHRIRLLDLNRALVRSTVSCALAAAVALLLLFVRAPVTLIALAAWDAGSLTLFAIAWSNIGNTDADRTRARAAEEDPGRTAVYGLVLLVSTVSLFASTVLVRGVKSAPLLESRILLVLCLLAVALAWGVTHTSFALRYAHLYYREDEDGIGGIEFPGGAPPTYFDFAYFAFTIGMCFQVADTSITSRLIRRTALLQATMSFTYNTVILAFVLNLAFGLA